MPRYLDKIKSPCFPVCPRRRYLAFVRQSLGPLLLILSLLAPSPSSSCDALGADLPFGRHTINPESQYSACAVLDVNADGRLDIVAGGFWYEAPEWERRFLREVEMIGGRYDDYSNLPLDVNGDGLLDLVSANYRSRKLYWIEQPRPAARDKSSRAARVSERAWTAHLIDQPGPMETARLYDIDGDGRLDVLPNGVDFAAWWELGASGGTDREATPDDSEVKWIRHDLPQEVAGHGVGFGDVDGDGRGDIVGPRGYLHAPSDRRGGRWQWRPEFELHADASIPVLVLDVDGDGDNDLVYGRAHNIGLYWVEQREDAETQGRGAAAEGKEPLLSQRWLRHAIDTSASQYHSLLLADLDGDGRQEVVAGKRYLGHDGKDPGEYDPLVIHAYDFQQASQSWRRRTVSAADAAFGLDPKAADLDADGDQDLVCSDRNGLHLLENLHVNQKSLAANNAQPAAPEYDDHARLMEYRNAAAKDAALRAVESPHDWAMRRAHVLANVERVMGELPSPELRVPLDLQRTESHDAPKYVRHVVTYQSEPGDRVPAYLLVPKERPHGGSGKLPAMLCLHQTTDIGKGEPAGLGGLPHLHYAHELAEHGYVCLVPDYPSFGDYEFDFQKHALPSGSMKAVWNNVRGVDLLETLPFVDADKIGCIGHSLGGHNAIFTATFDQRIKVVVSSCGFTAFPDYYGGDLAGWTSDRYMPRIRERYDDDSARVPFDFYELVAALSPRPFFINAPLHDDNFDVGGVKKVVAAAGKVYELHGVAAGGRGRLLAAYPDAGHDFPDSVRLDAYKFLDGWLK